MEYHAVHFLLAYLSVSVLISLTFGSLDTVSESICEYEDANLIWRNTPTYSLRDVKAMAWYKGKGSLIATWLEGKEFMEYPPYIGRLMQIGETGIKIRAANRSDSGIYWLSLTLASEDRKLEAETYLEVKVAPSKLCKPKITQEGSIIKADLLHEGCGIPHLRTKWKYNNVTITQELRNSSSFLDMRTNLEPGEYVACAEGESATCYKGNIMDLCSKHTIHASDHVLLAVVISLVMVGVLTAIVLVLVLCRHRLRCRKPTGRPVKKSTEKEHITYKEQKKSNNYEMSSSLKTLNAVQPKTKMRMNISDIEKYLKDLYARWVTVPLSPSGEGNDYVNISDLYVNIALKKVEVTDLNNEECNASYDTQSEDEPLMLEYQIPRNTNKTISPILMFGDCGSGKSAWCKHLVQCWLQGVEMKDNNIGLNLPDLLTFKIILYLPLQFSDGRLSFQELLKKHLFKEKQRYIEFVMNYAETNAQEVLFVMDGLDIIQENIKPILDILNDQHMSLCTVIVTSRPASLKLLKDSCNVNIEQMMLFRVCKMKREDSKAYASNVLSHINELHGKDFKVSNFWRFTEQLHVNDLLSVPYICLVLLHVWMKNGNYFIETTDLLFDIIRYYLHRATSDQQRKEFIEDAPYIRSAHIQTDMIKLKKWNMQMEHIYILHVLSRIAADIFHSEKEIKLIKLNVPELNSLTESDLERICETGLLTEHLSLSANKKISNMSFPGRIIYEFFVSIFIALQEGKDYDFILSNMTASVHNTMIVHILYQLSDIVTKNIIHKSMKIFEKEKTNTKGDERRNFLNEECRFVINSSDPSHVPWFHWHMNNDALYATKLLFLSTALQCVDTITSLELRNHENTENLVFQLPCLRVLEMLTLDISKCTLVLGKAWDNHVPCKLKHAVIRSVSINKGTLSLLTSSLSRCPGLEKMELSPSVVWTDDDMNLHMKPDLDNYSWNKLSEHIENNNNLKLLELENLVLPGVVDTLFSRLNRYQNLEVLKLKNVSSFIQKRTCLSHSSDADNDYDNKPHTKTNLTQLSLERLKLEQSPINFLFNTTTKGKLIETNISVLAISALEMSKRSWKTLANQIGSLRLNRFHLSNVNPRGSLHILLDGIAMCNTIESLSLCKIGTGKTIPSFSFLAKLNILSEFKLREMKLDESSSRSLFNEICGCKQLKNLSLCNVEVKELPDTLSSVQNLTNLSVLTVFRVTIKGGSQNWSDLLNAFSMCESLKTIKVSKEHPVSIPSKVSAPIEVIYLDNY